METGNFDNMVRSFVEAGTRRGVIRGIVAGMAAALLGKIRETEAKNAKKGKDDGKRKRREVSGDNHKHPGRRRKHANHNKGKHKCKPKSIAVVCSGKCADVQNKQTCNKVVNCGPCDCGTCGLCQVCNPTTGTCVSGHEGESCGSQRTCQSGQCICTPVCAANNPCGDDGCGGDCGTCGTGEACVSGQCESTCDAAGATCSSGTTGCCSGVCTCGTNAEAGFCQGDFEQGFEQNASGWEGVTRVASGTNGIPAKSGGFYGQAATGNAAFTRWGGYASAFPQGGYVTETSIYIDPATATAGYQFDYSSAVNGTDCAHRRDFIFTAGKDVSDFCVSASNNSPGQACNPGRDPEVLTDAGWYTFRHEFKDVGGVLSVDMTLTGPNTSKTWTLSDPTDLIGVTVGGNRYGWFPNNEFAFVAIDDTKRES